MPCRDGLKITVSGICREDGTIEAWLSEMGEPEAQLLVPANEQIFAGQGGPGTAFWNEKDQGIDQQGMDSTVSFAALFFAPPGQENAVLKIGDKEIELLK